MRNVDPRVRFSGSLCIRTCCFVTMRMDERLRWNWSLELSQHFGYMCCFVVYVKIPVADLLMLVLVHRVPLVSISCERHSENSFKF